MEQPNSLEKRSGSENIYLPLPGTTQTEEKNKENLLRESDGSSSTPFQDSSPDDGEARNDCWSISGNYIYRHHVEPRVKLYIPREESFPIPLRYVDVTRATSTTLDVMLERRIDDYWNIEGDRDLLDSWPGFYTIHNSMKNLHGPGSG